MNAEQKRLINSFILDLRESMENELELSLKHYGIFLDRYWLDVEQLDFLSDEEKKIKKKIEIYIKRKEKIGINKRESTRQFITEATYHWLNRLLGLKCLESRKLLEEIITTRSAYGGKSITHRDYLEEHPELKKREDEGFFDCLFEVLTKLTAEIQIIFDPNDIHMLIKPRFSLLKEIIKKINNLDEGIYKNDEFLGWIYQYFHDKERDEIYKKIKKEKLKIGGSNLIPLTQLYTEDYMVRFLAQNSLGSIWMEMYPKSNLFKKWEYFVKSPNNETREVKSLSEIKILDPACGSGHFLLYLFDILYEMYMEEGKIAIKDIPKEIIEKNLYGIDIDTRAIQIAALILYIKYKEKTIEDSVEIPHFNLFSADIISYKTEVLNDFLNKFENNKFLKKIIVTIWSNLEDIREIGSLSKIDQIINTLIDEEIKNNKDGILHFTENRIENWQSFREEIISRLKNFLQEAIQTFDINKELFAKEEEKGVWLIEAFENKYDVIITNPPYLGSNKLNNDFKNRFKKLYPMSYRDLCNMFLNRIPDLLEINGYAAMVTMQSFMFIDVYKEFRKFLLNNIRIRKLIHLGKYAFFDNTGAVLQTILLVFQPKNNNVENVGIYYNLQKLSTAAEKTQNLI
ncbi:MAG: Eco57I restriction-modification methylase domain-containing protein, partial [Promethearchaeota archaeon]